MSPLFGPSQKTYPGSRRTPSDGIGREEPIYPLYIYISMAYRFIPLQIYLLPNIRHQTSTISKPSQILNPSRLQETNKSKNKKLNKSPISTAKTKPKREKKKGQRHTNHPCRATMCQQTNTHYATCAHTTYALQACDEQAQTGCTPPTCRFFEITVVVVAAASGVACAACQQFAALQLEIERIRRQTA